MVRSASDAGTDAAGDEVGADVTYGSGSDSDSAAAAADADALGASRLGMDGAL